MRSKDNNQPAPDSFAARLPSLLRQRQHDLPPEVAPGNDSWRSWLRKIPFVHLLRSSFALRVATILTFFGVMLVAVMFAFVSLNLKSDVYEERVKQIEEDAAVRFSIAQAIFNEAAVNTIDEAQQVASRVVADTRNSSRGARGVGVVLQRLDSNHTTFAINDVAITDPYSTDLVSPALESAVARGGSGKQFHEPVALEETDGMRMPGVVVGGVVNVPLASEYGLYIIYSLRTEQETVSKMLRSILAGSLVLLILLSVLIGLLTYRALEPVKKTALAAERLASGEFDARVEVTGIDELALLGHSFNNMAQSLKTTIDEYDELAKLQQRFVSDVSHELRTPLTTIRMASEVIYDARHDLDLGPSRSAELLHASVERFEIMLADLLEISRYDARSALPDHEFIDITELCRNVIADNSPLAEKSGTPVELVAPEYPVRAEVDAARIERVLRNLFVNALEHGESRPVIITVAEDDNSVAVRVRDHGIGMTEEVMLRVFDRFYRADAARARTTGGTGLGLAISKEDANLHNGMLQTYGKVGEGSAFMLTIPRRFGEDLVSFPLPLWEEDDTLA